MDPLQRGRSFQPHDRFSFRVELAIAVLVDEAEDALSIPTHYLGVRDPDISVLHSDIEPGDVGYLMAGSSAGAGSGERLSILCPACFGG